MRGDWFYLLSTDTEKSTAVKLSMHRKKKGGTESDEMYRTPNCPLQMKENTSTFIIRDARL